jgi:hypothetical protein
MSELGNQSSTRAKFFRGASRQTVAWYRFMSHRTQLSYWQVQRLKMLSYGIPVHPREFGMGKSSARNVIYKLKVKLPWLVVRYIPHDGYVVSQPCLDELKRFMEQEG